jgi:hypothetical protein
MSNGVFAQGYKNLYSRQRADIVNSYIKPKYMEYIKSGGNKANATSIFDIFYIEPLPSREQALRQEGVDLKAAIQYRKHLTRYGPSRNVNILNEELNAIEKECIQTLLKESTQCINDKVKYKSNGYDVSDAQCGITVSSNFSSKYGSPVLPKFAIPSWNGGKRKTIRKRTRKNRKRRSSLRRH